SFSKASYSEILWETVDLSIIAKSIIMNLKAGHPERDVDFVVYPNLVAKCDPALLHSVIQNLLNNAWKFTEKTEKAKIIFGAMYGDQEQIFYIQDNGVGFDPKYADKLFVPFQRLHDKDQYTGTGLGLSIVKKIIDRHGGNIWAESEPDKGATFFFTLKQNTLDKK
ncbi:MAG: ATP-binding protein, partial [Chlorobiales bacterium]|nr:ATP-binding protein [Chlorobiales bacterium]